MECMGACPETVDVPCSTMTPTSFYRANFLGVAPSPTGFEFDSIEVCCSSLNGASISLRWT